MKFIVTAFLLNLSTYLCQAQVVTSFNLVDVDNGQKVSLNTLAGAKGTVVIFHSNKCAYSDYYIDRIKSLHKEFAPQGIGFLLINSNSSKLVIEESPENMAKYKNVNGLQMPYLADKETVAKKALRASRTPEAFLLNRVPDGFKIVYKGAIDDSPQSVGDISHSYLREAVLSLMSSSTPAVNQTRPVGCLIK